ncbi:hypothetical protein MAR_000224 [Mya arenaria]|uniref:Uncharacterized protein n=1 Tax=Mya arenaria TaxID=6604 RepID=A0ABY7FGM4_MYAAR|nr:hypothetical protein MAR_000224 [Mya arenaria]
MQQHRRRLKEQPAADGLSEQNEHIIHDVSHASVDDQSRGACDSTSAMNESRTPVTEDRRLLVNMKFCSRRGQWKKSQSLKKAQVKINKLERQLSELRKRNNSLRKKVQRTTFDSNRSSNASVSSKKGGHCSLEEELRHLGISPAKHTRLVKKLTFHNSLVEEIKSRIVQNRGRSRQRTALEVVSGKLMKKYRLRVKSSRALGVNRGQLLKADMGKSIVKRRQVLERTQLAKKVRDFLERDDNSSCLPGKRDSTKTKTGMKQTRVLNDYMYNLHLKFKAENPWVKISLTTFSSYRPRYAKMVQYSARKTCLCHKHQNIALKVKGLKNVGAITTENPDQMVRQYSDDEIVDRILNCNTDTIKFAQWKRKEVEHKDTQSHNTGTVYAFIKRITERLKNEHPGISYVHYITDSPTSQYRNKNTMYLVANHVRLFGLNASLQFWEAGHGKGPCDGVGVSSKRLADLAVKRQTAVIQSAEDYYNWGKSLANSQTKYAFVTKEECDEAYNELLAVNVKPIKGTLQLHGVFPVGNSEIFVKNTSCFCEECFTDGKFNASCDGWIKHTIVQQSGKTNETDMHTDIQNEPEVILDQEGRLESRSSFIENEFVAAIYNDYWYIGKVVKYDPSDDELPLQVSFMEHGKGKVCPTFKWPSKYDSIWMSSDDMLCSVGEPMSFGSRKMYKVAESDINKAMQLFDQFHKRK